MSLLKKEMVHCAKLDVKAHVYSSHQCVPLPTKDDGCHCIEVYNVNKSILEEHAALSVM